MSSLRRLAKDHATLRATLPPNYLFSPTDDSDSLPDDLTQLSIHLTGSEGTPYSSGVWLLNLRIPQDYPKSPPKATFKTRIFHPNVEETTGAVCLETLKRDWDPKLTLKDILITISCLLIQPNPDSALNEKAGVLVREDYDGFVRQARLMTKIHAPIPAAWKQAVDEARRRGEEPSTGTTTNRHQKKTSLHATPLRASKEEVVKVTTIEASSSDESADSAKENKPVTTSSMDLKKHVLGKRPLAELTTDTESGDNTVLLPSQTPSQTENGERPRKSPKHTHYSQANGREITPSMLDDVSEQVDRVGDVVSTTSLSMSIVAIPAPRQPAKTKYRPYARIGIKRL